MSENANQPNGINQYIGKIGIEYRIIDIPTSFGKQIYHLNQLPKNVLLAIIDRMKDLINPDYMIIDENSFINRKVLFNKKIKEFKILKEKRNAEEV